MDYLEWPAHALRDVTKNILNLFCGNCKIISWKYSGARGKYSGTRGKYSGARGKQSFFSFMFDSKSPAY